MIHVLHVHSGNLFGGVERILETLAGYTPPAAPMSSSFALCFRGRLSETLQKIGAPVHDLGETQVRRPERIYRARRRLRSLLRLDRYDVVLVHSSWSQAIFGPVVQRAGVPLVRWLHAPEEGARWLEHWARRSRPALTLCNSRYTWSSARSSLGDIPAEIHYPPARCPPLPPATVRAQARARMGINETTIVILMAARLEPLKGHRVLLRALTRLSDANWQLWIAGGAQRREERKYLRELEAFVAAAGLSERIRFLGERHDVADLMCAADIYCQPNVGPEAFGLSFIEALAAGLPVIATRLGAAPEILDEACGMLVEPGSTDDLVVALGTLLRDTAARRRLGENGRRRSAEFCDLPSSFNRLASTLSAARPTVLPL